jgi:hypothetical protein
MPGKNFNKKRRRFVNLLEPHDYPEKKAAAAGIHPPVPEFTLKWSSRRRTIGLTVTLTGELVVSAPVGTGADTIAQAVNRHREWIARKITERRDAAARLAPGRAYYLGRPLPVRFTHGTPPHVELAAGALVIRLPGPEADPWPQLAAWYRTAAGPHLVDRVRHYAMVMGLTVGALELCDWQRRWGECRPARGLLRFNWRLILLDPKLVDYVVVHELAHLEIPGHPPAFWRRLGEVLPDWAARRRRLNRDAAPMLGWRLAGGEEG